MSAADILNQLMPPIILGVAGIIAAILGSAAIIIRSHAETVKHQADSLRDEKKIFLAIVNDLRKENVGLHDEISAMQASYRDEVKRGNAQEEIIRQQLIEISKLKSDIAALRNEQLKLSNDLDNVKAAREQRERELAEERAQRRAAETQLKELQELFALETANWQTEREALTLRIDDLKAQVDKLTPRVSNVEEIVRQTPVTDMPAVSSVSSEEDAA